MKTLLLLIVIGVAGFFVWRMYYGAVAPEVRVCERLGELCGKPQEATACERTFADLRKAAGDAELASAVRCLEEARSCPSGLGCMAGLIGKAGASAASEFLKGLGHSLAK
jgi:hypothetical protein